MTHYIRDQRQFGPQFAVCGIPAQSSEHAPTPDCADCRRILEQDDDDFLGTFGDPTVPLEPLSGGQVAPRPDEDAREAFNHQYDRRFGGSRR